MNSQKIKKISIFVLVVFFLSATGAQAVLAQSSTAPNSGLTSSTSENWSGYASVENGASYTAVSGSWNVPTPTISANEPTATDATWVGIGGVTGQDLIQAGTQAVVQNGTVSYEAWVETLPSFQQILPVTVHGGDSVSVSLNQTSTGEWQLSFRDNTSGQNYSETINYNSSLSSAEWIEEMPAGVTGRGGLAFLPLDNFGTMSFTGASATVNGNAENISGADGQSLTMMDSGYALATPSSLGADGASFSVTRSSVVVGTSPTESQQPTVQRQGRGFRRNGVGAQGFTRPTRQTQTSTQTNTIVGRVSGWRAEQFSFQNFQNQFVVRFLER